MTISERRKRVNLRSFDLAQSTMNVVRFAFGLLLLRFCVVFASLLLCFCFAFAFAFVLLLCCLCFPNGGAPLSYIHIYQTRADNEYETNVNASSRLHSLASR